MSKSLLKSARCWGFDTETGMVLRDSDGRLCNKLAKFCSFAHPNDPEWTTARRRTDQRGKQSVQRDGRSRAYSNSTTGSPTTTRRFSGRWSPINVKAFQPTAPPERPFIKEESPEIVLLPSPTRHQRDLPPMRQPLPMPAQSDAKELIWKQRIEDVEDLMHMRNQWLAAKAEVGDMQKLFDSGIVNQEVLQAAKARRDTLHAAAMEVKHHLVENDCWPALMREQELSDADLVGKAEQLQRRIGHLHAGLRSLINQEMEGSESQNANKSDANALSQLESQLSKLEYRAENTLETAEDMVAVSLQKVSAELQDQSSENVPEYSGPLVERLGQVTSKIQVTVQRYMQLEDANAAREKRLAEIRAELPQMRERTTQLAQIRDQMQAAFDLNEAFIQAVQATHEAVKQPTLDEVAEPLQKAVQRDLGAILSDFEDRMKAEINRRVSEKTSLITRHLAASLKFCQHIRHFLLSSQPTNS